MQLWVACPREPRMSVGLLSTLDLADHPATDLATGLLPAKGRREHTHCTQHTPAVYLTWLPGPEPHI
jgi:hypothetical protein